jgi:hypothetical protein
MIERSDLTKSPPVKPAIGVSSCSSSNSMAMPFGGRLATEFDRFRR